MIEVRNLTKRYGPRKAIDSLNFSVGKGEIVGFLGPNGAGKSTTMKILTGFMPATEGTAKVAGADVFDQPLEVKQNVGYLPENPPVYLEMRVADYLDFAASLRNVPSGKKKSAVDAALGKTGLGDVRNRIIGNLSKGFRQRVGLAQALVHDPKVAILDEPTVGLDPVQIIEIRELIRSLAGDHTVILSSHILPEVTATCQRIIVIHKGKIVATDTLDNLTKSVSDELKLTLECRNATPAGLEAVKKVPGIGAVSLSGNQIQIKMPPGATDVRDKIVETAVGSGLGVLEFRSDQMSLEDIYLRLTAEA